MIWNIASTHLKTMNNQTPYHMDAPPNNAPQQQNFEPIRKNVGDSQHESCFLSLARTSAKEIETIISAEITQMLGEGWLIDDLRGRLQSVRVCNEPQETISLDGKPLIELWPVELKTVNEGGKITIKAIRRYRTFRQQNP